MYSIKEIINITGFPISTLRYYEQLGLLKDVPRDISGKRYYTEEHRKRLEAIACFKAMGMKMESLSAFFEYEADVSTYHQEILTLLNQQKEIINEQILLQQANLEHVNQKIGYFTQVDEAIRLGNEVPSWDGYNDKIKKVGRQNE